jgi:hypothetical protein
LADVRNVLDFNVIDEESLNDQDLNSQLNVNDSKFKKNLSKIV